MPLQTTASTNLCDAAAVAELQLPRQSALCALHVLVAEAHDH